MFEPPSRAVRYAPLYRDRNVEVLNDYLPPPALDLLRPEIDLLEDETALRRAPTWVRNVGVDLGRKSDLPEPTLVVRGWVEFDSQDQRVGVTDAVVTREGGVLPLSAVVVVDAPTIVAVYERDARRGELLIPVLPGGAVRLFTPTRNDDYAWVSTSPTADHGVTWSELFPPPYREQYRQLFRSGVRHAAVLNYNYRLTLP